MYQEENESNRESVSSWTNFRDISALGFRFVRTLSLKRKNLVQVPLLYDLDLLSELDLSENGLGSLPEFFLRMIHLRELNLSSNIFREPPEVLFLGLYKLKKLDLSFNGLLDFSRVPCCLSLLEHINLAHNQLSRPPGWLLDDRPSKLTHVYLSWNPCFVNVMKITSRKTRLQISDNVKVLDISCCGFKDRHIIYLDNFSKLKHLIIETKLSCAREQRNCFKEFNNLSKSLKSLNARRTGILNFVPCVINKLNLRELDISSNVITGLSTAPFGKLNKLVVLKAENCRINFLPVEFNMLRNLKELHLAYNDLYSFDCMGLTKLEVLDLYMNDFFNSPKIETLHNLTALDIDRNLFNPVRKISFSGQNEISYDLLKQRLRSYVQASDRLNGIRPTTNKCRVTEVFERDYDEVLTAERETEMCGIMKDDSCESRFLELWKERQKEKDLWGQLSSSSDESSSSHKYTSYHNFLSYFQYQQKDAAV